jgi:hypothetical protein
MLTVAHLRIVMRFVVEQKIFLLSKASRPLVELNQVWVLGGCTLGTKRPGHEPDHSTLSRTEVMNEWNYTSTRT